MTVRTLSRLCQILLGLILILSPVQAAEPAIRNVILMIPDGLSVEGATLARWMNEGKPLAWDPWVCGLVTTFAADAPITDSAPAATAYATGHKSHTGFLGIRPDQNTMPGAPPFPSREARRPLVTLMEAARIRGMATGLVVTSEVTHATPAAFYAHSDDRKDMEGLARQLVEAAPDLVLGGGRDLFDPGKRRDGQDLLAQIRKSGHSVITTARELETATTLPLCGLFAPRALVSDLSAPKDQPSLNAMTRQALNLLEKHPQGFFLLVEGSQIDWGGHGQDPVAYLAETRAFDQAVGTALAFARKRNDTVVVVVPDHGCGGLSLGGPQTNENYDRRPLVETLAPLKAARLSGHEIEKRLLADPSPQALRTLLQEQYGLKPLSPKEEEITRNALGEILEGKRRRGTLDQVLGPLLSARAGLGWTSNGHTGGDVLLAIYHPSQDRPCGVVDNTAINRYLQRLMAVDLDALTRQHFAEASSQCELNGLSLQIRQCPGQAEQVILTGPAGTASCPVGKRLVRFRGLSRPLSLPTLRSGGRYYLDTQVFQLLGKPGG